MSAAETTRMAPSEARRACTRDRRQLGAARARTRPHGIGAQAPRFAFVEPLRSPVLALCKPGRHPADDDPEHDREEDEREERNREGDLWRLARERIERHGHRAAV